MAGDFSLIVNPYFWNRIKKEEWTGFPMWPLTRVEAEERLRELGIELLLVRSWRLGGWCNNPRTPTMSTGNIQVGVALSPSY